jgi:hypothetical protein
MNISLSWLLCGLFVLWVGYALTTKLKHRRSSPIRVVAWSWGLMFLLSATQIVEFPEPPLKAVLYLLSFPCLIMAGTAISSGVKAPTIVRTTDAGKMASLPATLSGSQLIVYLGLLGLSFKLYLAISGNLAVVDVTEIRDIGYVLETKGQMGWVERVAELTFPFTWMSLVIGLLFGDRLTPFEQRLICLYGIGVILYGVSTLGRTVALRVILMAFSCVLVRRELGWSIFPWRRTAFRNSLFIGAMALSATYFLTVWGIRSGGFEHVTAGTERFHWAAKDSPMLESIYRILPERFVDTANFVPLYTATIADNFCFFFEEVEIEPINGFWQMFGLSTVLGKFGVPVETAVGISDRVEHAFELQDLQAGQWRTMAQEFIFDFGKVGALVAAFLAGVMFGRVYKLFSDNGVHWGIVLVLVNYWIMFGAGTSPLNLPEITLLAYLLIFVNNFRVVTQQNAEFTNNWDPLPKK